MDGVVEMLGDGLTAARIAGEDAVGAHVAGAALDMELQVSVVFLHGRTPFFVDRCIVAKMGEVCKVGVDL